VGEYMYELILLSFELLCTRSENENSNGKICFLFLRDVMNHVGS
jgi:hypothetical protein